MLKTRNQSFKNKVLVKTIIIIFFFTMWMQRFCGVVQQRRDSEFDSFVAQFSGEISSW